MSIAIRHSALNLTGSAITRVRASVQGSLMSILNRPWSCHHLAASASVTASKSAITAPYCSISTSAETVFTNKYNVDSSVPNDGAIAQGNTFDSPFELFTWLISTLKRRKKKMNKHKLRKRRKKERLKTKK